MIIRKFKVYFKPAFGQSTVEYLLLLAAIVTVTVFGSQFITTTRTAAESHRDTAVERLLGPGRWPDGVPEFE